MLIGILGGGLSGLTLQRLLRHESEILEKEAVPGGLCRTFWKDGFGYDIGGHILFSRHPEVTDFVNRVLGENRAQRRRANKILLAGRYVKYPFENDLAALDPADRYECLIGYLRAEQHAPPRNLEEWSHSTFGAGIAEKYLVPYNDKIWKRPSREIGLEWVSRIPRPPLEDVVKSACGIETEGYTHQLHFQYPLRGGAQALTDAIAGEGARIVTEAPVTAIRRLADGWSVTAGGLERRYDRIVVTFPVEHALRCLEGVPAVVQQAAKGLQVNALRIALVAVNNESLLDKSAVYIPDRSVLPHRVCFMGFFSPHMVRPGMSALVAEVTSTGRDELAGMSDDLFVERVVSDLERAGILRAQEVAVTEARRIEHAYPVPDLHYEANVRIVRDYCAAQGLLLLGRFGEFEYINSDECIRRAMKLAARVD